MGVFFNKNTPICGVNTSLICLVHRIFAKFYGTKRIKNGLKRAFFCKFS